MFSIFSVLCLHLHVIKVSKSFTLRLTTMAASHTTSSARTSCSSIITTTDTTMLAVNTKFATAPVRDIKCMRAVALAFCKFCQWQKLVIDLRVSITRNICNFRNTLSSSNSCFALLLFLLLHDRTTNRDKYRYHRYNTQSLQILRTDLHHNSKYSYFKCAPNSREISGCPQH